MTFFFWLVCSLIQTGTKRNVFFAFLENKTAPPSSQTSQNFRSTWVGHSGSGFASLLISVSVCIRFRWHPFPVRLLWLMLLFVSANWLNVTVCGKNISVTVVYRTYRRWPQPFDYLDLTVSDPVFRLKTQTLVLMRFRPKIRTGRSKTIKVFIMSLNCH